MRAKVLIKDGQIIKRYELSEWQSERLRTHIDDYVRWIKGHGFMVPETQVSIYDSGVEIKQDFINGDSPTVTDWRGLFDRLLTLPERLSCGVDANPTNFLFKDTDTYFIDFYPLLIGNDYEFLSSQFSYDMKIIKSRYFDKWNIAICFLNRLRMVDHDAFISIYYEHTPVIEPHLPNISGRDRRRLEKATVLRDEEYKKYYQDSKEDDFNKL